MCQCLDVFRVTWDGLRILKCVLWFYPNEALILKMDHIETEKSDAPQTSSSLR